MTLVVPKPGARLGLNDPLCHVKSTEELTSPNSMERENVGRGGELYSQVKNLEKIPPQTEEKPSRRKRYKS